MSDKPWEKYASNNQEAPKPWEKYGTKQYDPQVNEKAPPFLDFQRFSTSNIPSSLKDMIKPNPEQLEMLKSLVYGTMATSGGLSGPTVGPARNLVQSAGKKVYKSAFKSPDLVAEEAGAVPLSSYFENQMPIMTPQKMALENAKLGKKGFEGMRSAIAEGISKNAPTIEREAALGPALNRAEEISKGITTGNVGSNLAEQIQNVGAEYGTEIPFEEARRLSIAAGKEAKWAGAAADLPKNEVLQKVRHGLEGSVENSLGEVSPELLSKYLTAKQQTQTSLNVEPLLKKEIGKAVRKNNLTEVKGALLGHGLKTPVENIPEGMLPLAGMYAAKILNTPWGRTHLGQDLYQIGAQAPQNAQRIYNVDRSISDKTYNTDEQAGRSAWEYINNLINGKKENK